MAPVQLADANSDWVTFDLVVNMCGLYKRATIRILGGAGGVNKYLKRNRRINGHKAWWKYIFYPQRRLK